MRKLLSRKVALVALATPFAANAADLSILAYKAPPIPSWTGSYFGIYGGASGRRGAVSAWAAGLSAARPATIGKTELLSLASKATAGGPV